MTKTVGFQPLSRVLFLLFLISTAFSASGQKSFRGTIVYEISYAGSNIDLAEHEQLPETVSLIARKQKVRHEMKAGELRQIKIANAQKKHITTLLEIEDGKYIIESSANDIEERIEEMPDVEYQYTDEYQDILGYSCQKVLAITYDAYGEKYTSEIFFTSRFDGYPFHFDLPYHEIPGLMLKYEIRAGNLIMQYQAVSVEEKRRVRNKNFRIPSDYQPTSFENLQKKLSGEI